MVIGLVVVGFWWTLMGVGLVTWYCIVGWVEEGLGFEVILCFLDISIES